MAKAKKSRKLEKRTAQPYRRRLSKALDRRDKLAAEFETKGMSKKDAKAAAQAAMRENARGDWRAG